MGGQLALYAASKNESIGACVDFYGIHPHVKPVLEAIKAPVLGLLPARSIAKRMHCPAKQAAQMTDDWFTTLKGIVQQKPLIVFQFSGDDWMRLRDSRRGANEFSVARPHAMLRDVRPPTTLCSAKSRSSIDCAV